MVVGLRSRSDLAALILAVGVLKHYGWDLFEPGMKGVAAKGLNSLAMLALLGVILWLAWSWAAAMVSAWFVFEELQTVICTSAWLLKPWPLDPNRAMCSQRIDFDLGAVGIMLVCVILWRVYLQTFVAHKN